MHLSWGGGGRSGSGRRWLCAEGGHGGGVQATHGGAPQDHQGGAEQEGDHAEGGPQPDEGAEDSGEECGNRAQTGGEPRTGGLGAALQMGGAQLLSDAALQSAVGYGRPGLDQ